ncbi:hypothetical protein [Streptomyces sp. NPDC046909]|uniref:hypothetical protein n=1 Tax=Streptomyces sp. NPDC046909 TaxID=3155617 RepID=UPI00340B7F51
MTGFLAELGRKLAERWFTLLVLPGLAYLLIAATAVKLGQAHWNDWHALWDGFTALTEGTPDHQNSLAARAALLILAAIPLSAAVGALAQALAAPVERALCGPWPGPFAPLSSRLTTHRETLWNTADLAHRRQNALADAAARRHLTLTQTARQAEREAARAGAAGSPSTGAVQPAGADAGEGVSGAAQPAGPDAARAGRPSGVRADLPDATRSARSSAAPDSAAAGLAPGAAQPTTPASSTHLAAAQAAQAARARAARYADIAAHHTGSAAAQAARRNALSLIRPEHPTHLGDRLRAPAVRLGAEYGIDLATVWPRLWLLLPASTRDTLTATRARLDAAFALGGWAVLYLPLALCWWPAGLIALVTALVSRRRAALAAEAYAELVEAAVDLHLDRLHSRLAEPRPSPQQGRALTERLRRGL